MAVSIDRGNAESVRKLVTNYVRRNKLTFLNLLDPDGIVAERYGVRGIPMNLIINPDRKVVAFASGYLNWNKKEIRDMFEQLLHK